MSDGRTIKTGQVYWVLVEPITWLVAVRTNIALSKKIVFSGLQFNCHRDYIGDFDRTEIKWFMDTYFSKEIVSDRVYSQTTSIEQTQGIDNKKREEQKRIFEKSCLVDRKSMFNNICHLVNCCDDMSAEVLNEYVSGNSSVFQKIVINYDNKEFSYKTLVDNIECYPDEIYDVCADANKDTNINFFEIKYYLKGIISGNELLKRYFDFIENYFKQQDSLNKRVLSSDDLNSLFNLISCSNYSKQKRLKVLD